MNFLMFGKKAQQMQLITPNGMVVYQTHFNDSAYAIWLAYCVAASIVSLTPDTIAAAPGTCDAYASTRFVVNASSAPFITAAWPTYAGRLVVNLVRNTLK